MMRCLRVTMSGHILIEEAVEMLDDVALKAKLPTEGCGAIVSFLGITRGKEGDADVLRLEFDAWQEQLTSVLYGLAEQAIAKFGVLAIAMAHRVGSVGPQEPIVAIHVGSPHRKEAFQACEWLIDELKKQAPLWKKEVTSKGESWKAGLG
jgi:molybdopterin synthase catalytic subunit